MTPSRFADASAWGMPMALAGLLLGVLAWTVGASALGVLVAAMGLAAAAGIRRGAARSLGWLLGLVLAAVLAVPLGRPLEPLLSLFCGTGGLLNRVASALAMGTVVALLSGAAMSRLVGRVVASRATLQRVDRWSGAAVGAGCAAMLALVLSWFTLAADPIARAQIEWEDAGGPHAPPAARPITRAARAIRDSSVGVIVLTTSPLRQADIFALAADFVAVARDPEAMAFFMESEAMRRVSELASVRAGLDAVRSDPALSGLFDDGEVSVGDVVTVLNSPALLRVLDTTPVVAELSPHADDLALTLRQARARVGAR